MQHLGGVMTDHEGAFWKHLQTDGRDYAIRYLTVLFCNVDIYTGACL